jgi:hypothetical protein
VGLEAMIMVFEEARTSAWDTTGVESPAAAADIAMKSFLFIWVTSCRWLLMSTLCAAGVP